MDGPRYTSCNIILNVMLRTEGGVEIETDAENRRMDTKGEGGWDELGNWIDIYIY